MKLTLGICNDETSSACLIKDGEIVSAVSEERFTRKKLDNSFPYQSIQYVLEYGKCSIEDVEVSYAWSKGFDLKLLETYLERYSICSDSEKEIFHQRVNTDIDRDKSNLKEFFKWVSDNKIKKVNHYYHHESHAASACLLSPYDSGVCLTADGRGDFESLVIWKFDRNNIEKPLEKIFSTTTIDSLGYFYGRITGLLGFSPMRHEGKITGLAAYGDPVIAMPLMQKMIFFDNGQIKSNLGDFYKPYFKPYSDVLIKEISNFKKEDIAAAAQKHLENLLCEVLDYQLRKNNIEETNLMLAGGVFGNVKATQKLKQMPQIKNVFVQPQMGDGGLCLGSATLSQHQNGIHVKPMKNVYLGPHVNLNDIHLLSNKFVIDECENIHQMMCNDLMDNKVVGIVRGRMEFGPRSLCHRSILYKTSDKSINDWINKRLNRTEFMPFAPVVRDEVAKKCFLDYTDDDVTLNFMTSTIDCTEEFVKKCPAVCHVDKTARPQIIKKNTNKFMWYLLKEWEKISGELGLVNTSFNAHEEPIICNIDQSLEALNNNRIDVVYIENYRITDGKVS
jgi:carbamoyltransferase